ncbi:MAG: hypothetical protein GY928_22625 [Colwellia sp.]|nr:hypothetical protein [Colwellia sp.]
MAKKRKLNSKNPKYWDKDKLPDEPVIKKRVQVKTHAGTVKVYAVFL